MVALLISVIVACASTGHRWDHKALKALRAGSTTEAEAVELLGKPTSRTNFGDNGRILIFQHVEVIYVATTESKTISLLFEDDRLVRIVQAINLSDELLDEVELHVPIQSRIHVGGGQPISQ